MPIIVAMAKSTPCSEEGPLRDAAASAHDALTVSRQMMEMLREYAQLEAEHASRLHDFSQRMGDCVDRMRAVAPLPRSNELDDDVKSTDDQSLAPQSQCVAVMDEVVTFLTRFSSMHRHLSECIASDLFDEWSDELEMQQRRIEIQEPELPVLSKQLQVAENEYTQHHGAFHARFQAASELLTRIPITSVDEESIARKVKQVLDESASETLRRERSPSTARKLVESLSRRLTSSDTSVSLRRRGTMTATCEDEIVEAIAGTDHARRQCQDAYQEMHRLHVRHSRLCNSLYQEYECVQNDCLASIHISIRKLTIHLSAFTSNLQYDATQLFQQVEALHADKGASLEIHHTPFATSSTGFSSSIPPPPADRQLTLEHLQQRHFPTVSERPRLLRHQNARLALAV